MEPAPGERDDRDGVPEEAGHDVAAMEPAPGERDDFRLAQVLPPAGVAAMEPAPGERDDAGPEDNPLRRLLPQWSPLLVSGMTAAVSFKDSAVRSSRNGARSW